MNYYDAEVVRQLQKKDEEENRWPRLNAAVKIGLGGLRVQPVVVVASVAGDC